MNKLPLVIVNPASAGGATADAWPGAASELRRHFGAFECYFTKARGDARAVAERAARAGRRLVVACGGDGTINEVADGILRAGAGAELGILPSGTGGDFRRTLGVPRSTREAARSLREGRARVMDAGRVTFFDADGREETRHFVNVASVGMGGDVIKRVKSGPAWLKGSGVGLLGGSVAFAAAALGSAFAFEKPRVRVRVDGGPEFRLTVANLCVANARYFGGGMKIAPTARLDDGLFDVVAVGDMAAHEILLNSYRVYLGTHLGMRQVGHARARTVTTSADGDDKVELEIDGEIAGLLPATFEILPNALRVRSPR